MSVNLEIYQQFASLLNLFAEVLSGESIKHQELSQLFIELNQYFVTDIASLTNLNSSQQSYHTEMSKQLRLLELEITFLKGARKSETAQTRISNIKEKINTLSRYCQAMMNPNPTTDS
ncbi:MAG: hypothetical protein EAZ76_13015 [Nostocales cyanobacterium]|nr:MAG: hypothetical protein EAZ87_19535 [Nostocales cyanobacterium]TAF12855.1 MAG: hypothetical protein EAZ76_13015 [Nostocales cyanobacterium]